MATKVLITGATGLIGQHLAAIMQSKGLNCSYLARNKNVNINNKTVRAYTWDIDKGEIDERAFEGVSAIVHLAGAGVADKRWTDERKKEIISSRVKGAQMLYDFLKRGRHDVKTFISAAAVGYYGDCGDTIVTEDTPQGNGFLADVCRQWEQGAINIGTLGIREVRCRIGIVLAKNGGALPELTKTLPVGVATYFAKNNLYYPWVHIDDVCGIIIHAIENKKLSGPYNTTSPNALPMKDLMRHIITVKKAKAVLLPAPPLALKLALGEMSEMLIYSQRCSAKKVTDTGYRFSFSDIDKALQNIFAGS